MKRMFLVLSLAGLTVMAGASDAFAQRRGYGSGYGNSPSISIGIGRGYSPYGNYGGGSYSSYGYYGGGYSPYYQNYGNAYQFAPSYYTPSYSAFPSTYYVTQPQFRQSYYQAPTYQAPTAAQGSVAITVRVPTANAQVWFENAGTTQQGMERLFHSPPLEPNHNFTYTIKARWVENGQPVDQQRQVTVQAGQSITVSFSSSNRENVPPPLPLPNAIPRD